MEQTTQNTNTETKNPFPFNNLFLIKGLVTGNNNIAYYALSTLAAVLGYVIFQAIMLIPLMAIANSHGITTDVILKDPNILFNPEALGINKSLILALMMGMFVFSLLFFAMAIKYIQKKSLTSVITGFEKIRWKRYFFAFATWASLLVAFTILSYIIAPNELELTFDASKFAVLLIVAVIFIPIQTATEEILFRGFFMQGFGLVFKNGIMPLIITSVLFGLMHGTNPEVKAHGLLIMMPYYICFGAFLGMLTLLDEGAELAMGIHCANNLVSSLLVCSKTSVLQTDSIFQTSTENPAGEFIAWIIMAVICFFVLFKKYKLSNFKLILK